MCRHQWSHVTSRTLLVHLDLNTVDFCLTSFSSNRPHSFPQFRFASFSECQLTRLYTLMSLLRENSFISNSAFKNDSFFIFVEFTCKFEHLSRSWFLILTQTSLARPDLERNQTVCRPKMISDAFDLTVASLRTDCTCLRWRKYLPNVWLGQCENKNQ